MTKNVSKSQWKKALYYSQSVTSGTRLTADSYKDLNDDYLVIEDKLFLIDKLLGRGAYGEAYQVFDQQGNDYVAKITFAEDDCSSLDFPNNIFKKMGFIRDVKTLNNYEVETLKDLGRVVASSENHQISISVMPFLGQPFNSFIKDKTLSEQDKLRLAYNLILSIHNFHRGIQSQTGTCRLHNDLKDDNFLVSESGDVNLIDFGEAFTISKKQAILGEAAKHPRAISFEPYMVAPEVQHQVGYWWLPWTELAHVQREYSTKTDIYLAANTIVQLTGQKIFLKGLCHTMYDGTPSERPNTDLILAMIYLCLAYNDKSLQSENALDYLKQSQYDIVSIDELMITSLFIGYGFSVSDTLLLLQKMRSEQGSNALRTYYHACFNLMNTKVDKGLNHEIKAFLQITSQEFIKSPHMIETSITSYLNQPPNIFGNYSMWATLFCQSSSRALLKLELDKLLLSMQDSIETEQLTI